MTGVNKVILIGNLGQDPEIRFLESGMAIASFSLATSESYLKNGEKITQTEWHKIELWDNLAKIAQQFLKKSDTVYIEGKLRTENWTDKNGNNRETLRIRGTNLTILNNRKSGKSIKEDINNEEKETPISVLIERKTDPIVLPIILDDEKLPF